MVRVLIVDDHAMMREGLRRILEECGDIEIAAEARTGEEAVERVAEQDLDVVLLDVSLPGRGGVDALRQIKALRPSLPVLIVSMHPEEQYGLRVLAEGAAGYVMKERPPAELIGAIRKVASGGRYVTPSLAERLVAQLSGGVSGRPHEVLSTREDQVMRLIASGRSLKQVAEELGLSPKTISTYKRRILQKMNVGTSAELIRYAIENGLVNGLGEQGRQPSAASG